MIRLTPKQEKFCLVYLETGNASEAYRQAYDAKDMKPLTVARSAHELMGNPKIEGRLAELRDASTSEAVLTRQQAMERLTLIASVNITDILEFDQREIDTPDGPVRETIWRMKDSEDVMEAAKVSIKSVTMTKLGPKIEMHDKLNAIQQLSKLQGWESASKHELSGPGGNPLLPISIVLAAPDDDSQG